MEALIITIYGFVCAFGGACFWHEYLIYKGKIRDKK